MSSERRHSVVEQPEAKCPLIDKMRDKVESGMSHLKNALEADTLDAAIQEVTHATWYLEDLDGACGDLEDARKACEELRAWGQEWKDKAKEYYDEVKRLEEFEGLGDIVNELEDEIDQLRLQSGGVRV
jgi:predicted  nucleic acid-binding Zn-ribbon protein